ncbi:hypothetical protein ACMD2_14265 [Ananas comosus]|uniref:Uncharacterized protein n=1 Tax=Ananas comosus TaxID=4615 RepID=A0A199UU80_ANACO|nr:hypothetical protein ACMD2_14265 [Ananas comosus]
MQRMVQNGLLNFSQHASSEERSHWNIEEWYTEQGTSSKGAKQPPYAKSTCPSHVKDRRAFERNLTKVKKEWMKVKEEMSYARLCSEHLSESIVETDKKIEEMLQELDRTDKYVRDLIAENGA